MEHFHEHEDLGIFEAFLFFCGAELWICIQHFK
jgi:hypothetical protein